MKTREIVRGTEESCREKALAHVEALEQKFTDGMTAEEKYWQYSDLYKKFEHGVCRSRENFVGDHYLRFAYDQAMAVSLEAANRVGVIAMEILIERMESLVTEDGKKLAHYNGTSVEFARCSSILINARQDLVDTERVVSEKVLLEVLPSNMSEILVRLDLKAS